jgi:hypothetical protein
VFSDTVQRATAADSKMCHIPKYTPDCKLHKTQKCQALSTKASDKKGRDLPHLPCGLHSHSLRCKAIARSTVVIVEWQCDAWHGCITIYCCSLSKGGQ